MRIGFAIYGSLETVSGGYVYDRALVGALGALGHQIDVIALPVHGYARSLSSGLVDWGRRALAAPASAPVSQYDAIIEDELIHPSRFGGAHEKASAGTTARP